MKKILKNGRALIRGSFREADILIEQGRIKAIGKDLTGDKIIDCSGKHILPGLIDSHVHFRDFGQEEKEDWVTGSRAALLGGITTVLDMPNNKHPITSEKQLLEKRKKVAQKSLVNFGLYMIIDNDNVAEINKIANLPAVKLYMGITTGNNSVDDLENIFKRIRSNILIIVHAEDNDIMQKNSEKYTVQDHVLFHTLVRNTEAETSAVRKIIALVKKYNKRVHFAHISSAETLNEISKAKGEKLPVTSEVCPHHLFLDVGDCKQLVNYGKMNPSLKYREDRHSLLAGLLDGTIDTIASDHAPHLKKEKEQAYAKAPSGVPGVETTLPLLLNIVNKNKLSLERIASLTSLGPALLFGLQGKGKIKEGYDADLTIVDLDLQKRVKNQKLHTKCKWSPFDGWTLKGWPVMSIVHGNVMMQDGKIIARELGKEVHCS